MSVSARRAAIDFAARRQWERQDCPHRPPRAFADEAPHSSEEPVELRRMLGAKALAFLHELELVGERQLTEITQLLDGYRIFRLRATIDEPKRVQGADPR